MARRNVLFPSAAWFGLCALLILLGGSASAQKMSQEEIDDPRVHGVSTGQKRLPTREATDAPDPGRLDPQQVITEYEGVPVVLREKHLLNGNLRSRIHVELIERDEGRIEEVPHGPQFHWHNNRTQWMQRVYTHGKQNGPYREWNPAGFLQVRGEFVDDQTHGKWEKYHENGFLLRVREWDHGKRVGITKNWHPSGELRRTTTWQDGEETGPQESFHQNGKLAERGSLRAGTRVGTWEIFHPSGNPASRGSHDERGRREGIWQEWEDSGALGAEGRYSHGLKEGEWFQTRLREGLEFREHFSKGKLHGLSRCFLRGGTTKVQEVTYEAGVAVGTLRTWYEGGSLRSEEGLARGPEPVHLRWFHEGGQVACEGQLENGLRTGVWRFYSADGLLNPSWSGIYEAGRRTGPLPD